MHPVAHPANQAADSHRICHHAHLCGGIGSGDRPRLVEANQTASIGDFARGNRYRPHRSGVDHARAICRADQPAGVGGADICPVLHLFRRPRVRHLGDDCCRNCYRVHLQTAHCASDQAAGAHIVSRDAAHLCGGGGAEDLPAAMLANQAAGAHAMVRKPVVLSSRGVGGICQDHACGRGIQYARAVLRSAHQAADEAIHAHPVDPPVHMHGCHRAALLEANQQANIARAAVKELRRQCVLHLQVADGRALGAAKQTDSHGVCSITRNHHITDDEVVAVKNTGKRIYRAANWHPAAVVIVADVNFDPRFLVFVFVQVVSPVIADRPCPAVSVLVKVNISGQLITAQVSILPFVICASRHQAVIGRRGRRAGNAADSARSGFVARAIERIADIVEPPQTTHFHKPVVVAVDIIRANINADGQAGDKAAAVYRLHRCRKRRRRSRHAGKFQHPRTRGVFANRQPVGQRRSRLAIANINQLILVGVRPVAAACLHAP